ncbi:MAG TPA: hypothetical protein VGB53_11100 [Rubricoccaceae bacterium]|jgi:hypothetical protein
MLPQPRTCLLRALGASLTSAALVLAWAAYAVYQQSLGPGPRFSLDFATPFAFAALGFCAAPILALHALTWLQMYRAQAEPGPGLTRATVAVGAAVTPALLAVAWVGLTVVVWFLG